MNALWVAIGGSLGALARYGLAGLVQRVATPYFPFGTFAVNVIGCLLFGVLAGTAEQRFALGPPARAFLLIGILGGFTTFSSFTFETFQLLRDGDVLRASLNVGGQIVFGMLAMWGGYVAARLL